MITFATDVRITRPIDDVFAYVSDPCNLPHWNSAVQTVHRTSAGRDDTGATYSIQRQLRTGSAANELEVVASERPTAFAIYVTAGPTPFLYRYRFTARSDETVVNLEAEVELPRPLTVVPQLARRMVKRGVDSNLATLKRILEASTGDPSCSSTTSCSDRATRPVVR